MSTMKFGTVEEAITDGYRVFFRAETEDGRYYWQTGDNLRGEKRFLLSRPVSKMVLFCDLFGAYCRIKKTF